MVDFIVVTHQGLEQELPIYQLSQVSYQDS